MVPFNLLLTWVELGLFYSKKTSLAVIQKITRAPGSALGSVDPGFPFVLFPSSSVPELLSLEGTSHAITDSLELFIPRQPEAACGTDPRWCSI